MEKLDGSAIPLISFIRAIHSSYAMAITLTGVMLVYSIRTATVAILLAILVSARRSVLRSFRTHVGTYGDVNIFYVNRLYLYDINNLINLKLSCNMFFQFSFYLYNLSAFFYLSLFFELVNLFGN